jgi:hypothetical protein
MDKKIEGKRKRKTVRNNSESQIGRIRSDMG